MHWVVLYLAIGCEVCGTTLLKLSEGFTKPAYSIATAIAYTASFFLLSIALKKIEVGISYAIWSGVGMSLIAIIGIVFFKESMALKKIIFLALIFIGTIGLSLTDTGH